MQRKLSVLEKELFKLKLSILSLNQQNSTILGTGYFKIKEKNMYVHIIRYGLLPMVLFPKLTKVDKGKVCLSLLDGRRAASADSVQMRILYSPRKGVQSCLHNNII